MFTFRVCTQRVFLHDVSMMFKNSRYNMAAKMSGGHRLIQRYLGIFLCR
ncbi:hypothetical protein UYSO10_3605 [Kosakonia radicincitans]|nr:hypothetical protein UYSO10_3605 [Kosakonia radicincitans]